MHSERLQSLAFALGLAGFAALLLAGLFRSVVLEGVAPPLSNQYGGYVNELAARQDWEGVLRELRLSARLDLIDTRVETEVVPNLVRVARREGDLESELVAWRSLAERRPSEASAHLQLAWALLNEAEHRPRRVREAALQARWALALDAGFVAALVCLGRVSLLEGRSEEGFARWDEAAALDPDVTERLLARLAQRHPEAVESFRRRASGGDAEGEGG